MELKIIKFEPVKILNSLVMKVIGKRISILREQGLLSIVILAATDRKKLAALFLWLTAWTVCGLIVAVNYFKMTDRNARLFIIVYLSFWFYFEFNIVRTFIWRKWGREKIWLKDGKLHYQREVNGRGKIKEYDLNLAGKAEVLPLSTTRFADTINQSFWIRGGERVQMECQARTVRMAMQVTDEEARSIVNEINKGI
jgi:hypothetical protein